MEISLEKIDIIRERSGVTYAEAREILLETDGDVVEALIRLEGKKSRAEGKNDRDSGSEVLGKVKDLITKGAETKVKITKGDRTIMDIPLTAGVLGSLLAPQLALVGTAAALVTKCSIEFESESTKDKTSDSDKGEESLKDKSDNPDTSQPEMYF